MSLGELGPTCSFCGRGKHPVKRWEYGTCQRDDLDARGAEGWEAYAMVPWEATDEDGDCYDSGITFYLKRLLCDQSAA